MRITPLQLAFYKGASNKWGALQFNYQRPHYYVRNNPKLKNYEGKFILKDWLDQDHSLTKEDLTSREGALFLEITSTKSENVYDWDNKIVMALSIHDMGKILLLLEGATTNDVKITHDPGAKSPTAGKIRKYLSIQSPQGIKKGVLISVSKKSGDEDSVSHTVPLSGDEVKTLGACIRKVIPSSLGW